MTSYDGKQNVRTNLTLVLGKQLLTERIGYWCSTPGAGLVATPTKTVTLSSANLPILAKFISASSLSN